MTVVAAPKPKGSRHHFTEPRELHAYDVGHCDGEDDGWQDGWNTGHKEATDNAPSEDKIRHEVAAEANYCAHCGTAMMRLDEWCVHCGWHGYPL